jgi:histidyl-tRNA synthetase
MGARSLKAQLREANSSGARYALILGEDEIKAGAVQLRDMSTSQQQNIPLSQLEAKIRD